MQQVKVPDDVSAERLLEVVRDTRTDVSTELRIGEHRPFEVWQGHNMYHVCWGGRLSADESFTDPKDLVMYLLTQIGRK